MPDLTTKRSTEPQWREAAAAISDSRSVLAVSHIAPDGDAVGSLLGLAGALRDAGKVVAAVIDGGVPTDLRFVPQSETVLPALSDMEFDLMISLDSSDIERIGVAGAYGLAHSKRVINLDHHPTNTRYGDIHLIVPEAVAATEIVFDFLNYLGSAITSDIAYALLTGLITDTQGFRISATTGRTLEIAQSLMACGAPLAQIMAQTLNRRPYEEIELWKRVLPTARLDKGLISADIRQADVEAVGLRAPADGGLVSHLVNVDRALISVVFKETAEGGIEVSLRAKPGFNVAAVAFALGGGGHTLASGCTIAGSLAQAKDRVLPLLRQAIAEGTPALE